MAGFKKKWFFNRNIEILDDSNSTKNPLLTDEVLIDEEQYIENNIQHLEIVTAGNSMKIEET